MVRRPICERKRGGGFGLSKCIRPSAEREDSWPRWNALRSGPFSNAVLGDFFLQREVVSSGRCNTSPRSTPSVHPKRQALDGTSIVPDGCLGTGGTKWAVATAERYAAEFFDALGLVPNFRRVNF